MSSAGRRVSITAVAACIAAGSAGALAAQQLPGRSIGSVTTLGDLILMELDSGAIAAANLFDLDGRTLRFTPDGDGYRVESMTLRWDTVFGPELETPWVTLSRFEFPFSGQRWSTFSVAQTGTISFGERPAETAAAGGRGGRGGGRGLAPPVDRFAELREAARTIVNTVPSISVFLKPRMSGPRYAKELSDRVVVTWDLTEPAAGIFDFTWVPTVNRFQAVLYRNGRIELSYSEVAARDAIVGVYPMVAAGRERMLAQYVAEADTLLPGHLDLRGVRATAIDGVFFRVTFATRGPVPQPGDPTLSGSEYRAIFNADPSQPADAIGNGVAWTIRGIGGGPGGGGRGGAPRYVSTGEGVIGDVIVDGNTIALEGILPASLMTTDELTITGETRSGTPASTIDRFAARKVDLSDMVSPEVDLSTVTQRAGSYPVVFESFHHAGLPRSTDMACTVIEALGDRFDFFVWYSDFRVDNQEAGTPSTGPRGGNVTGTGQGSRSTRDYCSDGRFQWMYAQPVYIGSNQGMERSPDGSITDYRYAMSQVGHELGHRWTANANALVNGETIPLGPTHWARGLHVPAAFPYWRPTEASLMGGGVWQDNLDGTYTQLDDNFYVPATGWSHLDLYLMGLIAPREVPDFFLLRNIVNVGEDDQERAIVRADRVKITIADVIAANGLRQPSFEISQKAFNTGVVIIVGHGQRPSPELVERANGIRRTWLDFWSRTTGRRSTMTASPDGGGTNPPLRQP